MLGRAGPLGDDRLDRGEIALFVDVVVGVITRLPLGRPADNAAAPPDLEVARKIFTPDAAHLLHLGLAVFEAILVEADKGDVGILRREAGADGGAPAFMIGGYGFWIGFGW